MQCTKCRNNVPNSMKFCPECGSPIAQRTQLKMPCI